MSKDAATPPAESIRLAVQSSADRLERLLEMSSAFATAPDAGAVHAVLVRQAREAIGAATAVVAWSEDAEGAPPVVAAAHPSSHVLLPQEADALARTMLTGRPLFHSADAPPDGRAPAPGAWAAIPLGVDGLRAGAVLFGYDAPRPFAPDAQAYLRTIAQQAAHALARIRAEDALREEVRRRERTEAESLRLNLDLQARIREFQTLLDVLPVGIAVAHDAACGTITTNRVLAELLGVSEGTNITKSRPEGAALPYRLEQGGVPCAPENLPMQTAARTGREVRGFECDVVRDDGRTLHLLVNAAPLLDEQGAVRGALAAFMDITPQRQHHERLRLIARATNDALWDYDLASDNAWGSDAYHAFYGGDTGKPRTMEEWASRIHPMDRVRVTASLAAALASDATSWVCEYRFLAAGGRELYILDRAGILRDSAGAPRRITGSMVDMSERKREEEALRERQARLLRQKDALADLARSGQVQQGRAGFGAIVEAAQEALRVSRVGIWLLDDDGGRLHRETAPASPDEPASVAVGQRYLEALVRERVLLDSDRADGPPTCPRTVTTLDAPVRVRGRLAGVVRHEHSGMPREWTDDETAFAASVADLVSLSLEAEERIRAEHALRESEARFRTLADHAPAIIWMSDAAGACVYVNRRWEEATGRAADEGFGDGWMASIHPDDAPGIRAAFRSALQARAPFSIHYRLRAADGTYRWMEETGVPRTTSDGTFAGYVGAGTDVTDRRAAERELDLARRQLAQSEKLAAMGSLVAGVAHEIRTPLAYMNNNAHLMMLRLDRLVRDHPELASTLERVREPAASIAEGVERIERLVGDLRRFHRPGPVQRDRHPLSEVVRGVVRLFESTHHGAARVELDAQSEASLYLDKAQLEQVMLNLLENASDVTPTKGTIRVTTRTPEPGRHEIVVEDEGPGIPPEVQARMFDPFFTTKPEGTGLGLSIVQRIVDAHDGSVRAEPRERGGTRFVVTLRG